MSAGAVDVLAVAVLTVSDRGRYGFRTTDADDLPDGQYHLFAVPVRAGVEADVFALAEAVGAEIDGGEHPDYQAGYPGSPPTITFTDRQLQLFCAALARVGGAK